MPVGIACHRYSQLGSWDKMLLPWIGTRCFFVFGKTISIPADVSMARMDQAISVVQEAMDAAQGHAEKLAERNESWPGESIEQSREMRN